MFFLGTTFFGGRYTIDPSPLQTNSLTAITIQDGTYDQIFASKNSNLEVEDGYADWDFDTILNANFDNGTLDAGNSGFSLNNTDTVVVKCREVGTFDWTTIFTRDIHKVEDFKINEKDFFRKSKVEYEYMVVSVCNGIENAYASKTVYSIFDGLYVCDKYDIFGTIFDLGYIDNSIDTHSSTLDLLNDKYPVVVSNSDAKYAKGNASGVFLKINQDDCTINIDGGAKYREQVKDWLENKHPKIMKFHDGRIWLISITGEISDTALEHNDRRQLSFDWVEIGNVNDAETLYNNGLTDVGREWWY